MGTFAFRTYAIICFFYGVFGIACGAVALYWAIYGIPQSVLTDLPASIHASELARAFSPWLGGGFLVFGIICIAVGVFAYSRYISAMIVGCLFWILLTGRHVMMGGLNNNKFALVNALVFVLLTIMAAIAARRRLPATS
jgi:hypothetical protein